MSLDQLGHLQDLLDQTWVPLAEHVPDEDKVPVVAHQGPIGFQLFLREPFPDLGVKGRPTTVFAHAQPVPFGLDLDELLLIDGASELDPYIFHGVFFFCDQREQKQDCHCANNGTS